MRGKRFASVRKVDLAASSRFSSVARSASSDNEEAARVIDRAQADADLALSLAKEATAKKEATDTSEQLERLKKHTK